MNSKVNKWCGVLHCTNTSIKTPNKLFIYVPHDESMRKKWLNLARRDPESISPSSPVYFCEDHFDMPNDMENFMQYHVMGSVSKIRMRPGCIPTKFEWQTDGEKPTSNTIKRPNILKKPRKKLIDECEKDVVETNLSKYLGLEILPGSPEDKVHTDEIVQTDEFIVKTEHICETDMDQEMYDGVCDEKQCAEDVKCIAEAQTVPDLWHPEEIQIIPESSCNICNEPMSGLRHACAQCGCALCGACAARGQHAHHFVLRIPPHATPKDTQSVLTALRQLLESLPLDEDPCAAVIKEEVKTEDPLSDDGESQDPLEVCGNTTDCGQGEADTEPPVSAELRALFCYEANYMEVESEANVATFTHNNFISNIPADTILADLQNRNPHRTDDSHSIPQKVQKHNRKQSFQKNIPIETAEVPKFVSIAPKGSEDTAPAKITSSGRSKPLKSSKQRVDRNAVKAPQETNNDSIALNIETIAPQIEENCVVLDKNTENIILIQCPTESISVEKMLELSSLAMNAANEMQYIYLDEHGRPLQVIDCSKEVRVNITRLTENELRDAT